MHRKCRVLFAFGLLFPLMIAACGQAAPAASSSAVNEHFSRGNDLSKAGKFQEAADEYLKALSIEPENVNAMTNLGVTYYHKERFDDAIAQYLHALELAPNDGDIHSNLAAAFVQKYQLSGAQDQLDKALEEYEKAVQLKPDLAEAYYGLGAVYALLTREQDAIKAFETFQKLDKGSNPQASENAKQYLQQLRGE